MLRKTARGDWIVFYSPKTAYPDGAPLQAFTAIGQLADDEPFVDIVSRAARRGRPRNVRRAPQIPPGYRA
jgi:hypothetical protein